MKIRLAAFVLLAAVLAACSSSSGKGNGPAGTGSTAGNTPAATTPTTAVTTGPAPTSTGVDLAGGPFCTKLSDAENKLSSLAQDVGNMDALKSALNEEISAFKELQSGAPSDVAASINDRVTVLTAAGGQLANPSANSAAALSDLASKLPADATKIGTYVATHCSSS